MYISIKCTPFNKFNVTSLVLHLKERLYQFKNNEFRYPLLRDTSILCKSIKTIYFEEIIPLL